MPNRLGWLMKLSFRVYLMSVRVISWRNTISKLRFCLGWNWNECRLTSCNIKNSSFTQSLTVRVTSTRQKFYSRENQIYWCNHKLPRMQIFKNFKILDFFQVREEVIHDDWKRAVFYRLWEWFYLFMTENFV